MFGYWSPRCPVRTDHPGVLATAYVRNGEQGGPKGALFALASWAKERTEVRLEIDWPALGIDENTAQITATAIDNFQPAAAFRHEDPIPVEPGQGWLLIVN
jgi:hypothetical protein